MLTRIFWTFITLFSITVLIADDLGWAPITEIEECETYIALLIGILALDMTGKNNE